MLLGGCHKLLLHLLRPPPNIKFSFLQSSERARDARYNFIGLDLLISYQVFVNLRSHLLVISQTWKWVFLTDIESVTLKSIIFSMRNNHIYFQRLIFLGCQHAALIDGRNTLSMALNSQRSALKSWIIPIYFSQWVISSIILLHQTIVLNKIF